mmetsp:Transcript_5471/g.13785  ORF Transcript_5471/g.13785 Transcript_5471/m.13785 type:complete len:274 (-) Transcript_5471:1348-2169(-)
MSVRSSGRRLRSSLGPFSSEAPSRSIQSSRERVGSTLEPLVLLSELADEEAPTTQVDWASGLAPCSSRVVAVRRLLSECGESDIASVEDLLRVTEVVDEARFRLVVMRLRQDLVRVSSWSGDDSLSRLLLCSSRGVLLLRAEEDDGEARGDTGERDMPSELTDAKRSFGVEAPERVGEESERGVDAPERGVDAPERGVDSPERGVMDGSERGVEETRSTPLRLVLLLLLDFLLLELVFEDDEVAAEDFFFFFFVFLSSSLSSSSPVIISLLVE